MPGTTGSSERSASAPWPISRRLAPPVRPVTLNGGYRMRAWYDIFPPPSRPDVQRPEDEPGLREACALVQGLLDREAARGVPASRTVLMGFSQGCAMTLMAGLRAPQRLAGRPPAAPARKSGIW